MFTYAKAIVSGLIASLGSLATGLGDGSLSPQEYLYAGIAFLAGLGIVAVTPNKGK